MATRIIMPQLGESIAEGVVSRWLKQVGDRVRKDEPICEIVTDKVSAELPAPATGVLQSVAVPDGGTVKVGAELGSITETAEAPPVASEGGVHAAVEQRAPGLPGRYSPAVRRLAEEYDVQLTLVKGTGINGRVTKNDVLSFIAQREVTPPPATVPATTLPTAAPVLPGRLLPLSPMRRMIAEHMVRSVREVPHATTTFEVNMQRVVRWREAVRESFHERVGADLTFLPVVVRAAVLGLRENPILNSTWTDEGIAVRREINVGIAVSLEDGLIVPVIHAADGKDLAALAREAADLAARARAGKLRLDDVQGGTFTVNNPGVFGTLVSAPIINYPQAAILS
ncbi:MAG: dihydrolipoamide acetyltransferase family protein, partial [Chloroflexota bacterium]